MQNINYTQAPIASTPIQSGDSIGSLPTDQSVPNHNEIRLIDTLFKQNQSTINRILSGLKDVLIIGILFIVFSLHM